MADNAKKSDNKLDGVRYITIPVADNLDDATVEEAIRSLAPGNSGIVGNYADIQRAGAAIVAGEATDLASGVQVPPGVTSEDVAAARKVDAAVEQAVTDSQTGRASSVGDPNTGAAIPGGTYNTPGAK